MMLPMMLNLYGCPVATYQIRLNSPTVVPRAASHWLKRRNFPTVSSTQNKMPGTARK
jgi:hypothetical protein